MTILIKKDDCQFVKLPKRIALEAKLSWQAKGVLGALCALDDGFNVSNDWLISMSPAGRDALRTILTELEERGYLTRERYRDENGQYRIRREIDLSIQLSSAGKPTPESPLKMSEFPTSGTPATITRSKKQLEETPIVPTGDWCQQVVDLYNRILADKSLPEQKRLPRFRDMTPKRERMFKKFYAHPAIAGDIAKVESYLAYFAAKARPFYFGRDEAGRRLSWRADLEWLIHLDTITKVREGKIE